MTISLNLANVVSICTCITVIVAAIKALLEVKKVLNKPLDEINKKLDEHNKFLASDKDRFEKIDYVLEDFTVAINLLIKSQKTVLSHMRDGNHTGEIKERENELDEWLMEGKKYK